MRLFRHPVLCNYYLTYRCNAKCGFCDIWERPSPYVTLENVTENLRDLSKLKVRVIDFTGGEPLLHRQLPDFLGIAKQHGFITTVTTNCLLYPKYAEKLRGKIDMLHFSLDSVDKEKHNESRGVECYDHVMESIGIAKALGEKPDILFTVTNENVEEIEVAYEEFVLKRGLMLILNPVFAYAEVGEGLSRPVIESLRKWTKKQGVYLNESFLDLRLNGGNKVDDPVCRAASATIVISPENELLVPCYHLATEAFPIQGGLYELYQSNPVKKEIAKEGRLPECEGCTINCYMEPSFAIETGKYFWDSLTSTLKYSLEKWVYAS